MTSGSLHERITRALAFMLRHQPEDFDLELDRFGWGDLDDVLFALQERLGTAVDEDDLLDAIEAGDRPRYEVDDDKIRALYGHSFPIDPGEASEPPDELFIGVGSRDAERAEEHGLRSGRRAFLHLACTEEEAREAGRRAAKDYAVVTVFAGEAYDEGIDFYDRGALFLADEIPTEFLEVGEIQHDGIDRERRPRGRRNADGPRGPRRRGRGRGRGRGRDDDRGDRGHADRDHADRDRVDRDRPERDRPERDRDDRDRSGREERVEREPARAERPPAREREEAPERPVVSRAAPREQHEERSSGSSGPNFGLGLVDQADRAPKKASAPRSKPRPSHDEGDEAPARRSSASAPAPPREPASEPAPRAREASTKPAKAPEVNKPSGGFGAGL